MASFAPARPAGRRWAWVALAALAVHAALLVSGLSRPFLGLNEDDNAVFGLGAVGLARIGFTTLRFGIVNGWFDDASQVGTRFYTHHPQWLVVPSAILDRAFGASDVATRLPSVLLGLVSLAALFAAVRLATGRTRPAALAAAAWAVLPGVAHDSATLSEKAYVLAFSNLLFLSFLWLRARPSALRRALLLALVVAGCLTGWHFAFAVVAVWLYAVLAPGVPERRFLLVALPLVAALTVAANFLHFHLLRGAGMGEIFGALAMRSHPIGSAGALRSYGFYAGLDFTWAGALLALGALIVDTVRLARDRRFGLSQLFAVQPLLVLLLFQEWATVHAFGPLYWAAFVAWAVARSLDALLSRPGAWPRLAAAGLALAILAQVPANLALMRRPIVATPADVALLRRFGAEAPPAARIAMGEDYRGFCSVQVAEWYMRRTAHVLDWKRDHPDYIVTFTPQLGGPFAEQFDAMRRAGYVPAAAQDYIVILHPGP